MPIRNKTRARYESQTAEAQARRNDKSTYEFETCEFCGGTIVIWNGKRGACAMCQLKRDKEAAEPAAEEKKAMQIVLDVATGTAEQTYPEFKSAIEKHINKPFVLKSQDTCNHARAYGNRHANKMQCPACGKTWEPESDFEKRLCAPHLSGGYVNWQFR